MNGSRNEDAAQGSFSYLTNSTRCLVSEGRYTDNRLQPDALSANVSESRRSGPLLPALSSLESVCELGELLKQTPLEHLYSSRQYGLSNPGGSLRPEAFAGSGRTTMTIDSTGSEDERKVHDDAHGPQSLGLGTYPSTAVTHAPGSSISGSELLGERAVTGGYRLHTVVVHLVPSPPGTAR